MLTKWRLRNFKSIENAELSFAPLTVLAGANSSGKSSVIQSLLLISQTASSKVQSRTVILNGHLTRLGEFTDLLSNNSTDGEIEIGWECRPWTDRDAARMPAEETARFGRREPLRRRAPSIEHISYTLSLDLDRTCGETELSQLQPRLRRCSLHYTGSARRGARQLSISAERYEDSVEGRVAALGIREDDYITFADPLEYEITLDDETLEEVREELTSAEAVGGEFSHFLLNSLLVRYDEEEEEARLIASAICEPGSRAPAHFPTHVRRHLYNREIFIPPSVLQLLQERLGRDVVAPMLVTESPTQDPLFNRSTDQTTFSLRDWYHRLRGLSGDARSTLLDGLRQDQGLDEAIYELVKEEKSSRYALRDYRPDGLREAHFYLNELFRNSVKYVGPLRDDPKPIYPLAAAEDPSDVGLRGEYTAAVLDLHKDQKVDFISSAQFMQPYTEYETSVVPLRDAVLDWLRYMGVAEEVETRDLGKLGHEMRIVSPGLSIPSDLTHVGVGVSQVLPVVVACLLAEKDDTLVFEQPELHLHPRVQSMLADFFLSMSMLGKQCLIETHSEYLINRLRFRVASAPKKDLSSLIKTYFVEKREQSSHFREVEINEYGTIREWPEGFFDQSQQEAENILRAAAGKRRRERRDDA